ncbi:MAG TPA: helix-turn-helix transcriptional regulator [Bacillota bacterium]|nr:helix-turn-helix transcriptional regulator [Bacillota bacterium]HPJ23628.1 helix-turn-helix transcriptional regulator [Bacillota bacterium]
MLNLEKIGRKITELRQKHNLKQNELADILFVTHQAVSKWENGKSLPSIDVLYELTKYFSISIDYLLDDTEIAEDDYETLLRIYPRDSIISKFLRQKDISSNIGKIFYLLSSKERMMIIELISAGNANIDPGSIWHLLNDKERVYLLSAIISGKIDYQISEIYHRLTESEKSMISNQGYITSHKRKIFIKKEEQQ